MAKYLGEIIGEHASIDELRHLLRKVARSPAHSVLIYGETGTGKGLVARMVHNQSDRAARPFMDINCAAIPSSLLESELFGHERGAFTGAVSKKTGLIEAANGGTVFLDEIREMDFPLQAKLLTLLDTLEFRRIGAVAPTKVDVRFVATTNKILLSEVKAGRFREDLYYRLQVVAINLPPLRERGDDVFVLTDHFLRKLNSRYERQVAGLEEDTQRIFRRYAWPGNVRELENLLERIVILEEDTLIRPHHLPHRILRETGVAPPAAHDAGSLPAEAAEIAVAPPPPPSMAAPTSTGERLDFHDATAAFQRGLLQTALQRHRGSVSEAAADLGLSRHAMRHQMQKLGLI